MNAWELRPSSSSTFRSLTLASEFTVRGGRPSATARASAVDPGSALLFTTRSARSPDTGAESDVADVAVFGWPRMKLPPVAA